MIVAETNHVLYALEKLGHEAMSEAMHQVERVLADRGYEVDYRLTVKQDGVRLAVTITTIDEEAPKGQDRLPLYQGGLNG